MQAEIDRLFAEVWSQMPPIPECDHTALVRLMERMSAESFAQVKTLYLAVLREQMLQGRELGGLPAIADSTVPPDEVWFAEPLTPLQKAAGFKPRILAKIVNIGTTAPESD